MSRHKEDSATISVFARLRPSLSEVDAAMASPVSAGDSSSNSSPTISGAQGGNGVECTTNTVTVTTSNSKKVFCFDQCFFGDVKSPNGSQSCVYSTIGNALLAHTLAGYHATLFAYGQTGSGKTYTMMGSDDAPASAASQQQQPEEQEQERQRFADSVGLIPRLIQGLFDEISAQLRAKSGDDGNDAVENEEKEKEKEGDGGGDTEAADRPLKSFKLTVRFFEIYSEKAYDLLNKRSQVQVREQGASISASEHVVTSVESAMRLMHIGNKYRSVSATLKNERSSRSHTVFQVLVRCEEVKRVGTLGGAGSTKPFAVQSTLSLVDLAGSERQRQSGVEGDRFREMVDINLSLSTLRRVMEHLNRQGKGKPPYRESLLTNVLCNTLGGNCKTALVATVSPRPEDVRESVSTLEFADVARKVKTHAKVNVDENVIMLQNMSEEIERLRAVIREHEQLQVAPEARLSSTSCVPLDNGDDDTAANADDAASTSTCADDAKQRLEQLTAVYDVVEKQLDDHAALNRQFMEELAEKDRLIAAQRAQMDAMQRRFDRSVTDTLKARGDIVQLLTSIKEPLRRTAGCPQCDSWRTEVFVVTTQNVALKERVSQLDVLGEETRVELERSRETQERQGRMLADQRAQLDSVPATQETINSLRLLVETREEQCQKYIAENVRLSMESLALKQQLQQAVAGKQEDEKDAQEAIQDTK